jgi:hypothetical protein
MNSSLLPVIGCRLNIFSTKGQPIRAIDALLVQPQHVPEFLF